MPATTQIFSQNRFFSSFSGGRIRSYMFGFNGMEKVNEQYGEGNAYDFGERLYDPRIGKWMKMDFYANAYPFVSPYSAFINSPLMVKDVNGDYIYLVAEDGTVYRADVDNPNTTKIKDQIGYNTLRCTSSGAALLDQYEADQGEHIYIKIGTVKSPEPGEIPQAGTWSNLFDVKSNQVGAKIPKLDGDLGQFEGVQVKAAGKTNLIIYSKDFINGEGSFAGKDNDKYERASVLYHEIKAHVDLTEKVERLVDEKIASGDTRDRDDIIREVSHGPDGYGSYNSGYNGDKSLWTPAMTIAHELQQLKAKENSSNSSAKCQLYEVSGKNGSSSEGSQQQK